MIDLDLENGLELDTLRTLIYIYTSYIHIHYFCKW